jgi:hypothetical protein
MKSGVQTAGEGYLDKMASSSPSLDDILTISLGWMIFDEGCEVGILLAYLSRFWPQPPLLNSLTD